jgi:hypothetical protein
VLVALAPVVTRIERRMNDATDDAQLIGVARSRIG